MAIKNDPVWDRHVQDCAKLEPLIEKTIKGYHDVLENDAKGAMRANAEKLHEVGVSKEDATVFVIAVGKAIVSNRHFNELPNLTGEGSLNPIRFIRQSVTQRALQDIVLWAFVVLQEVYND